MEGWKDGMIKGWMDIDGLMDSWIDGCMDRWIDGQMNRLINGLTDFVKTNGLRKRQKLKT